MENAQLEMPRAMLLAIAQGREKVIELYSKLVEWGKITSNQSLFSELLLIAAVMSGRVDAFARSIHIHTEHATVLKPELVVQFLRTHVLSRYELVERKESRLTNKDWLEKNFWLVLASEVICLVAESSSELDMASLRIMVVKALENKKTELLQGAVVEDISLVFRQ